MTSRKWVGKRIDVGITSREVLFNGRKAEIVTAVDVTGNPAAR